MADTFYKKATQLFLYFPQNMTMLKGEITHNTLASPDKEDTRIFSKRVNLDPGKRKYLLILILATFIDYMII